VFAVPPWSHRFAAVASRLAVLAACAVGAPAAQAGAEPPVDPLLALRERLTAKLGAVPVPPSAAVAW